MYSLMPQNLKSREWSGHVVAILQSKLLFGILKVPFSLFTKRFGLSPYIAFRSTIEEV